MGLNETHTMKVRCKSCSIRVITFNTVEVILEDVMDIIAADGTSMYLLLLNRNLGLKKEKENKDD